MHIILEETLQVYNNRIWSTQIMHNTPGNKGKEEIKYYSQGL